MTNPPQPMSRGEADRRRGLMFRLVGLFVAALALMITLPTVVRLFGTEVPAGKPYGPPGNATVFVRVAHGTRCEVIDGRGNGETVDVPADNAGWTAIKGVDVAGATQLTCERDATMTTGAARWLSYPFRAGPWLGLPCIGLWLAVVWFGLRTIYLRRRHGVEVNRLA